MIMFLKGLKLKFIRKINIPLKKRNGTCTFSNEIKFHYIQEQQK